MPKLAIFKNYNFFIVSFDLSERLHVHVAKEQNFKKLAKFWLSPDVELENAGNLTETEITLILKIIKRHRNALIENIEAFRHGEKRRPLHIEQ